MIRATAARLITGRLQDHCRPLSTGDLGRSALVVAPHYDDETLGCGATLALKARHDATIGVLFVSDGAGSHGDRDDGPSLADQRRSEAVGAVGALGLDPSNVAFGELPDGDLTANHDRIARLIADHIGSTRPEQLFVPHLGDGHDDHTAVTTAAFAAIDSLDPVPVVFEYPVWHWQQWPWVALDPIWRRRNWGPAELHGDAWRRSAGSWFGMRFVDSLDVVVDVSDTIEVKRRAAAHYETQMSRQNGDADWATLHDVSHGRFLERLLTGPEYFRVTTGGADVA